MKHLASDRYILSTLIKDGHKFTESDIKILLNSLKPWFRFLKEQNKYFDFIKLTNMDRLMGAMYIMKDWTYDYPCPVQNILSMMYEEDSDKYFFQYCDHFKRWCRYNCIHNYRYDLGTIRH